jgi:hypothetical protein
LNSAEQTAAPAATAINASASRPRLALNKRHKKRQNIPVNPLKMSVL